MAELRLDDVGYRYPKATSDALAGVDATLPAGRLTAVMGATGAGKSTLLMTLNGVVPQLTGGRLRGRVRLDDADLAGYRVQTIAEFVGLVLQDAESQLLGRTVAEDVAFGPRNHQVPAGEILDRVAESLATVGLAGFETRETAQLSGGEKQRLAIAGALASRPQVLCLDEPTSELDPAGREALYRTLDDLRHQGVTIAVAEHDSAEVAARADDLVLLAEGGVAWQGPPSDFFRDPEASGRVRPLPVAVVGRELQRSGLIPAVEVPLDVDAAEALVRRLAGDRPLPAPQPPATTSGGGRTSPAPPFSAEPVIELRNLSHAHPNGRTSLHAVDLTIGWGEYVALVGRNGAGKTTLAKRLNGLLRPRGGTVRVNGVDATDLAPWELARHVGYVFQNPDHQIVNPTVAAEVRYGLKLLGLPAPEIELRIDEVLERTGLAAFRDVHPFALGKGLRQRLAVASVLALRPAILVVDEPTTGQDWAGGRAMLELIDRLNAEGTTIVLITHDLEVAAQHARRVVVLDTGEVVADGPTAEVLGRPELLARAGLPPTQVVDLCRRLWPRDAPLLDAAALGRHLAAVLAGEGR